MSSEEPSSSAWGGEEKKKKTATGFRSCLVCEARTENTHFGVDVCRACAAFFKRAKLSSKQFVCRQGTNKCHIHHADRFICRRCRFVRCVKFGMTIDLDDSSSMKEMTHLKEKCTSKPEARSAFSGDHCATRQHSSIIPPLRSPTSSSGLSSISLGSASSTPLLDRILHGYKSMCATRRFRELRMRGAEEGTVIDYGERDAFLPTTLMTMAVADGMCCIAMQETLKFIENSFDGFNELPAFEKTQMLKASFLPSWYTESFYQTERLFPGNNDLIVLGPTGYISLSKIESFWAGAPTPSRHKDASEIAMWSSSLLNSTVRPLFREAALSLREFVALFSLHFCCTNASRNESPSLGKLADSICSRIFTELHLYYRRELQLEQYAERIGRIMSLHGVCQNTSALNIEEFEMYRLINVLSDDDFTYKMSRDFLSSQ